MTLASGCWWAHTSLSGVKPHERADAGLARQNKRKDK